MAHFYLEQTTVAAGRGSWATHQNLPFFMNSDDEDVADRDDERPSEESDSLDSFYT